MIIKMIFLGIKHVNLRFSNSPPPSLTHDLCSSVVTDVCRPRRFPPWCGRVAMWGSWAAIAVANAISMWVGQGFSHKVATMWILSCLASVLCSFLLLEPLKVRGDEGPTGLTAVEPKIQMQNGSLHTETDRPAGGEAGLTEPADLLPFGSVKPSGKHLATVRSKLAHTYENKQKKRMYKLKLLKKNELEWN